MLAAVKKWMSLVIISSAALGTTIRNVNAVQQALANILTECGQGFTLEERPKTTEDVNQRPADILLSAWTAGKDTAVDITVCHGWQLSERLSNSREKWRAFLRRKEAEKHHKYDTLCKAEEWHFLAMAYGTWGGQGPECTVLLHRIVKRAAGWLEEDLRAGKQEEMRMSVGLALSRQVWAFLEKKNTYRGAHISDHEKIRWPNFVTSNLPVRGQPVVFHLTSFPWFESQKNSHSNKG